MSKVNTPSANSLIESFTLSTSVLKSLLPKFQTALTEGLSRDGSMLAMLPTFVTSLPSGQKTEKVLVVDLGGTNLRVGLVELYGISREPKLVMRKHEISDTLKSGCGTDLFDFIANQIFEFIKSNDDLKSQERLPLGFTFSFATAQCSIASGVLLQWSKAFNLPDVIGQDVVKLLQDALLRLGLVNVKVCALLNDTVGTLMARAYLSRKCKAGVILGTGTNAAYIERINNIKKLAQASSSSNNFKESTEMVVNCEWGGFGDGENIDSSDFLHATAIDLELDHSTINSAKQRFEKMVSGKYLGEIFRLGAVSLSCSSLIKGAVNSEPYSFESRHMGDIEVDASADLYNIGQIAKLDLGISTTFDERKLLQRLAVAISTRSARLCAVGIVALYYQIKSSQPASSPFELEVAVDGALYQYYPSYPARITAGMHELLAECEQDCIRLVKAIDMSSVGAAVVAALT